MSYTYQELIVNIDDLLLDPMNPRFADIGDDPTAVVPEERFAEAAVQASAMEKMSRDEFDVASLQDSIKANGFTPYDRIVVRQVADKYVVIEGNRRTTALKSLLAADRTATITLPPHIRASIDPISVLVLSGTEDELREARWRVQGLRHVNGVKDWHPYQKARALKLFSVTAGVRAAADSLGMPVRDATALLRSYDALEAMRAHEEYGEHAKPQLFSYFEEALRAPTLRRWLEWNDTTRKFDNSVNASTFYSLISPVTLGSDGAYRRKLPMAIDVRSLRDIVNCTSAMDALTEEQGTLTTAVRALDQSAPPQEPGRWRGVVSGALSALQSMSTESFIGMTQEDRELLRRFGELANRIASSTL